MSRRLSRFLIGLALVLALVVVYFAGLDQGWRSAHADQEKLSAEFDSQRKQLHSLQAGMRELRTNLALVSRATGIPVATGIVASSAVSNAANPTAEPGSRAAPMTPAESAAIAMASLPRDIPGLAPAHELTAGQQAVLDAQIAAVEQRQAAAAATASAAAGSPTPALGPASPPPASPTSTSPTKRSWGPEQAVGAPDTFAAGDIPTAWAPLSANGSQEWLQVNYDTPVAIDQVVVRETYNVGAISRLTALVNGQETVIWEGIVEPTQAPIDSEFPITQTVTANSIIIYFDTARVQSWDEIDAVELVGKDGTHQWATSASASSTYAARPTRPTPAMAAPLMANSVN